MALPFVYLCRHTKSLLFSLETAVYPEYIGSRKHNNIHPGAAGAKGWFAMMRDPKKTIGNLIANQKVCYLSSNDAEGYPITRAMGQPRKMEGIRVLFFSANTSSQKVEQFRADPKGSVYFCDRRFIRGVVLRGTVEVLTDEGYRRMLWEEGDERFYPQGVNDPDYCVLKFTATDGRYYSGYQSETFPID